MGRVKNKKKRVPPAASGSELGGKKPKFGARPDMINTQTICWHLRNLDLGGKWGWNAIAPQTLLEEVHSKLSNFETMTWDEISKAAGGKKSGNNSHQVPRDQLCKDARDRLKDIGQDDVDELFSLRLSGTARVWGIKHGRVLSVIWWDPDHEVCESAKR